MQHVIIGLFCGIIFVLVFRTYTPTLGLSFAGIVTIAMTLIFLLVTLPRAGIATSQLTLTTCVQVVISIAVANAAYGLLLGATCRAYLSVNKSP
jgi:peptidoglycan biosynthesis protein MviN/MurJ (putative lipid II flippase)